MPKLLLKFEAAVIKEIKADKTTLTVGRKPDNDIVLDNQAVSGHHCKIYSAGDTYFVEDLNSTNGTFVNGRKILKSGLHQNDAIGIAKYTLVYIDDAKASEPAPAAATPAPAAAAPAAKKAMPELPAQKTRSKAALEILEGGADPKTEHELTELSTYIGKSSQANIQYKGAGLFNTGPDMAAVITMRTEGYYLIPVKEGYAKHNGNILNEKVLLADDDVIEVGVTKFRFFLRK